MHPSTSARTPGMLTLAALLAAALGLLLGACTAGPAPAPGPSPAPSGTASASSPTVAPTTSARPGPVRVTVTAGDVALEVRVPGRAIDDPGVHVRADADAGTSSVTVDTAALDDLADGFAGWPEIALRSAGRLVPHPDGSVTVLDGDVAVGGLSAPRGARLVAVGDTRLELRSSGQGSSRDGRAEVGITLGTTAVAETDWGEREGGRSLAVAPTDWARAAGRAGVDVAWSELTATDAEVDTPTMRDQLECHAIGAPDKATWNLEPWRPDVGLLATMAARCNPTS